MDHADIDTLIHRDAEVLLHPASSITALQENGPQMITGAQDCHIIDAQGRHLLDAVAGLWCVNVGYGRERLTQAMKDAGDQLPYYHSFSNASNPWQVELADKVLEHAPDNMSKVFFGSSGSDANDTLVKIAWHYHDLRGQPGKVKVIAREQAYHGTSITTASLTGLPSFHKGYPMPLDFVLRTDCPHYYTRGQAGETEADFCDRLVDNVRQLIEREGADTIAAFIAEPIHAAGGIIEPPAGYYPKLKALLKANDILLLVDEVVCGFGRLGTWFGAIALDIEPDMMSCAKAITSGYFPMSACLISQAVYEMLAQGSDTYGSFFHGYTYSGHPIGCAVGVANLDIIETEQLVAAAASQGTYLHDQLNLHLGQHPHVGEIRGRGMLAGVQLVKDRDTKDMPALDEKWPLQVANRAREAGVIVRPLPTVNTLAISPPLTFSRAHIDELVSTLKHAIDSVTEA